MSLARAWVSCGESICRLHSLVGSRVLPVEGGCQAKRAWPGPSIRRPLEVSVLVRPSKQTVARGPVRTTPQVCVVRWLLFVVSVLSGSPLQVKVSYSLSSPLTFSDTDLSARGGVSTKGEYRDSNGEHVRPIPRAILVRVFPWRD